MGATIDSDLSHYNVGLLRINQWMTRFFTQICDCSENTELIDRNNSAKNCLNGRFIRTDMNRQFPISFALQLTSVQCTGGLEYCLDLVADAPMLIPTSRA